VSLPSSHPNRKLDHMKPIASLVALLLLAATAVPAHAGVRQIGLDPSFGGDGTVLTTTAAVLPEFDHPDFSLEAGAAAVDRQERVIVGVDAPSEALLVRYRRDGSLDRRFVERSAAAEDQLPEGPVGALTIDWQGRLVAVVGDRHELVVARYLPDGSLDPSFGNAGVVALPIPRGTWIPQEGTEQVSSISIDGWRRIVVARVNAMRASARTGTGFVLARLGENGALDQSFGEGGFLTAKLSHGSPFKLAYAGMQPRTNKAVVVATTFSPVRRAPQRPELKRFVVTRLLEEGTLDPGFGGGDGIVRVVAGRYGTVASGVDFDARGGIAIGGANGRGFGFARLLRDGGRDKSFGRGGRVAIRIARGLDAWNLRALAVEDRERIVFSGGAAFASRVDKRMIAHRLLADGRLDRRFGRAGACVADFPRDRRARPSAVVLTRHRDAIMVGTADMPRPNVYPPMLDPISSLALARCAVRR
jgi:uncharacterized delta-60 repeat protein